MRKILKTTAMITLFVLLLAACGAQAAPAGDAGQTMNLLLLVCEGSGNSYYVIQPMILTFDFLKNSIRVVNFYYQTQIFSVTRKGEALSMPINFFAYCDTAEIVKAFENTYGITVDRYVIYKYGDYKMPGEAFELLCPLVLDIPEELMGDEEYTTFNGTMKAVSRIMHMDYTKVTQPGPQEIGPVGLVSYYATYPDRIWASGDRFTMMMEDYKYWDAKNLAVLEALKKKIAQMDQESVLTIWSLMTEGQDTNVTGEDIAAWSQIPFRLPDEAFYCTAPGFTGVEMADFDAGALTGVRGYDAKMLVYDNDAMAQKIRDFIYGQ
jgi:hypothetical protein